MPPLTPTRSLLPLALAATLLFTLHPPCPIYETFHLLCPGCGTTHALLALIHLHPIQALHLNPLTTLLLPIALLYLTFALRRDRWPPIPPAATYTLLTLTALFTLTRNLP